MHWVFNTIKTKNRAKCYNLLMLMQAKIDSLTTNEIPNIKTLLDNSLDGLPELYPALKRGQQVTTVFKLPIVIHVE